MVMVVDFSSKRSGQTPYDLYVLGDDARIGRSLSDSDAAIQAAQRILRAPGLTTEEAVKAARAVVMGAK